LWETQRALEILYVASKGDDEEEVSPKMSSWPTAATEAGELGLPERELLRSFGPCMSCTHWYQPLRRLPTVLPAAAAGGLALVGLRRCAKNMHDPNGLLDARSDSPRTRTSISGSEGPRTRTATAESTAQQGGCVSTSSVNVGVGDSSMRLDSPGLGASASARNE